MISVGSFVISLDFELMWGVRDHKSIDSYGKNILGVWEMMPKMLDIFDTYNTNVTFATVGFLFFDNKIDLLNNIPTTLPIYEKKHYSPYLEHINQIGEHENLDKYHYATELIQMIQDRKRHEIGTHTYSHYYCLEKGQTKEAFQADIEMAVKVANQKNILLKSIIFPRNQYNKDYLDICAKNGISSYRGNETSWLYKAKNRDEESLFRRGCRLIDAYINISGHNTYTYDEIKKTYPYNIPSSRFLRPYSKKLRFLDKLRLNRIKSGMTYAAKNNLVYHLWWHPHNFGANITENLNFLTLILQHYSFLNKKYTFKSLTMNELTNKL